MNLQPPTPGITTSTVFSLKPVPKIPGLPKIINSNQIVTDTTIVKPKELIAGLLHQGSKGVVASGSKAGKTWMLLALALSVATGTPFLRWATAMGKVLYINFEIQKAFIKDRLDVLMKHLGLTSADNLDLWNLRGKTADFEALIANIIKETEGKGYALIILDPIYKGMIANDNIGRIGFHLTHPAFCLDNVSAGQKPTSTQINTHTLWLICRLLAFFRLLNG